MKYEDPVALVGLGLIYEASHYICLTIESRLRMALQLLLPAIAFPDGGRNGQTQSLLKISIDTKGEARTGTHYVGIYIKGPCPNFGFPGLLLLLNDKEPIFHIFVQQSRSLPVLSRALPLISAYRRRRLLGRHAYQRADSQIHSKLDFSKKC